MDWLNARRDCVTSDRYASGTLLGYDWGLVGLTNLVIVATDIPQRTHNRRHSASIAYSEVARPRGFEPSSFVGARGI